MTEREQRIAIAEDQGYKWLLCTRLDGSSFIQLVPPDAVESCKRVCRGNAEIISRPTWDEIGDEWKNTPNYPNDLNAMHEVEKSLINRPLLARAYTNTYGDLLFQQVMSPGHCLQWHATAAQRAKAYLKVKGLWVD